jgi:hypothetical protein
MVGPSCFSFGAPKSRFFRTEIWSLQENRVLTNGRMKVLRHKPPSSRGDPMVLRQSDKSKFSVPRVDELEGLGNAVA